MNDIHISLRAYHWLGFMCCVGAIACAIGAMHSGEYMASFFCVIFGLAFLCSNLFFGAYSINSQRLTYVTMLGTWRISWAEVSAAQTSPAGTLLLLGDSKHFSLATPSLWPRPCREQAFRFVCEQLNRQKITPTLNHWVDCKWMKNVRVRQE